MSEAAALPPMDVGGRGDRLRERLAASGCDAFLVHAPVDIRYLTGFTGSAGVLLVRSSDMVLVTDGRYGEQAESELAASGVTARIEVANRDQDRIVASALTGCGRLGFQADVVTVAQHRALRTSWVPASCTLVETEATVAALRLHKDDGEIARMARAAAIADGALAEAAAGLHERPTERAWARSLEDAMVRGGASGPSFPTIVAAGANGSLPHHRPDDTVIEPGDLVVVDFGARVEGYCSDMTRTAVVGEPTAAQDRLWSVVADAQAAGVAAVGAGVAAPDVDRACRSRIESAGWAERFVHGTGHGIGLEVHEAPRVAATSTATLDDRCVVTVEPGVYLPGVGGVRIEDMVLVTEHGHRVLTGAPIQRSW